jgi:hypothetical protein
VPVVVCGGKQRFEVTAKGAAIAGTDPSPGDDQAAALTPWIGGV